jgi:Tol biopolymer transport system component
MSVRPGTILGSYEVLSLLGSGGMGEVYRARDQKLGREVAVKILPDRFTDDPERLARFGREARVLAALNHPHIAAIYGLEASNGTQFLVLELVDGESLDKRIARGPIPVDEAMAIARQIAEALEAAHEKGIIHRDLKPANIAVTHEGKVKVLDFGLAKAVEATSGSFDAISSPTITSPAMMTGVGTLLGTAAYMAPEQAKGRAADRRSDIWAFGCVLYEMLAGRRAFDGEDVSDTLAFILTKEPDWGALPADTPAAVRRLLRRALQKDRSRRIESAGDARLEIDEAIAPGPVEASASDRAVHRGTWIGATIAALLLGALTGAWGGSHFWLARREERGLRVEIEPPRGGQFVLGGSFVGDFAISPDGKTIAYTASVDGKSGLWLRQLDGGSARLLPGTEDPGQPFWSPDGRSVGFVQRGTSLRIADVTGGTPVIVCGGYGMRAGSFTSDGSILFSAFISGKAGVFRAPASPGSTPLLVTAPDESRGELRYRWPLALPDGQFLYSVEGTKDEVNGVYAASLRNPAAHVKLLATTGRAVYDTDPDGKGFLIWPRGGTLAAQQFEPRTLRFAGQPHVIAETLNPAAESDMHLSASNGLLLYGAFRDVTQFAWFDRAGKPRTPVGGPLSYVSMFRLSPDERHIAVQQGSVQAGSAGISDLWLLDTERGFNKRFTSSAGGANTQPVWSPDGRTIVFTNFYVPELVRKAVSDIGDEQLVAKRPAEVMPTDWSRDGRWVLTRERGAGTGYDIWKIPVTSDGRMEPGAAPSLYLRTKFNEQAARFSPEPNPRWVAYASDESGRYEVYIDSFPERRGKIPISIGGGFHPMWGAADELFYVRLDDNELMSVALKVTPETIEASAPHELFRLPLRSPAGATYQPSGDGQRFLVLTTPERGPSWLNLIVNWPALVKKRAGAP